MTKTNEDIYNALLAVREEVLVGSVVSTKDSVVDLKKHVNDRNEAIELSLLDFRGELLALKRTKADKTQLLTSIGFKLLAKPAARWALGAIAAGILTTTVTGSHWLPDVQSWLDTLL